MAYLPGLKDSIRVAFLKILLATFVWLFTNLPEILVVSSIKNVSLITKTDFIKVTQRF